MVTWPDRRFLDLAGCEVPIAQAPMAGAGGVELAVGAIEGGALGSLPCGMIAPAQVREQVAEVRRRVSGPLNLNFFCHTMPPEPDETAWRALLQPYYDEYGVAPPTEPGILRLPFDEALCEALPYPHAATALAPIRKAAEAQGEFGFSPAWAGQAARLGTALPAAELTRKLAADGATLLALAR